MKREKTESEIFTEKLCKALEKARRTPFAYAGQWDPNITYNADEVVYWMGAFYLATEIIDPPVIKGPAFDSRWRHISTDSASTADAIAEDINADREEDEEPVDMRGFNVPLSNTVYEDVLSDIYPNTAFRGEWVPSKQYKVGDVVIYDSRRWVVNYNGPTASYSITPPEHSIEWDEIVERPSSPVDCDECKWFGERKDNVKKTKDWHCFKTGTFGITNAKRNCPYKGMTQKEVEWLEKTKEKSIKAYDSVLAIVQAVKELQTFINTENTNGQ